MSTNGGAYKYSSIKKIVFNSAKAAHLANFAPFFESPLLNQVYYISEEIKDFSYQLPAFIDS